MSATLSYLRMLYPASRTLRHSKTSSHFDSTLPSPISSPTPHSNNLHPSPTPHLLLPSSWLTDVGIGEREQHRDVRRSQGFALQGLKGDRVHGRSDVADASWPSRLDGTRADLQLPRESPGCQMVPILWVGLLGFSLTILRADGQQQHLRGGCRDSRLGPHPSDPVGRVENRVNRFRSASWILETLDKGRLPVH